MIELQPLNILMPIHPEGILPSPPSFLFQESFNLLLSGGDTAEREDRSDGKNRGFSHQSSRETSEPLSPTPVEKSFLPFNLLHSLFDPASFERSYPFTSPGDEESLPFKTWHPAPNGGLEVNRLSSSNLVSAVVGEIPLQFFGGYEKMEGEPVSMFLLSSLLPPGLGMEPGPSLPDPIGAERSTNPLLLNGGHEKAGGEKILEILLSEETTTLRAPLESGGERPTPPFQSPLYSEKRFSERGIPVLPPTENGSQEPPLSLQTPASSTNHPAGHRPEANARPHPPVFNFESVENEDTGPGLASESKPNGPSDAGRSNLGNGNMKDDFEWAGQKEGPTTSKAYFMIDDSDVGSGIKPFKPVDAPRGQEVLLEKSEQLKIYHQVGREMVLSARNGVEKIRLMLDPPQLGHLYMEVTKEKDVVKAALWTESQAARELLEAHRKELYKILEESGFKLEKFDVFVQEEAGRFFEKRQNALLKGNREKEDATGGQEGLPPVPPEIHLASFGSFSRMNRYIDSFI